MSTEAANRRTFLKASAAMGLAATVARPLGELIAGEDSNAKNFVRLGAPVPRAPKDPEQLALAHRKLGYRAAYCPSIPLSDKERIRETSAAFKKHDVVLAEIGRWCNLLDADPATRAKNLAFVTEGLALADEIGCRCCVNIAGSYTTGPEYYGPHPDNLSEKFFDAIVENARKIIDAVKPKRAKFCYEMMGWSLPDTADNYIRLLKNIDRDGFGVHLDPCNLINSPSKFYRNTDLLNECFDKLGPWIVSCHAKDLAWEVEANIHFREVVIGRGTLDYATYLKRIAALPGQVPLMMEHMKTAEEYDQCRQYLMELAPKVGIRFA